MKNITTYTIQGFMALNAIKNAIKRKTNGLKSMI